MFEGRDVSANLVFCEADHWRRPRGGTQWKRGRQHPQGFCLANRAYGQASIEGYFDKLSKAFVDFRQGVGHENNGGGLTKFFLYFYLPLAKIEWQL